MSTYLAIAYRYGWLNGDWHVVYCGEDLEKATALAKAETQDRGGKYGVEVTSYPNEESVFYSPSAHGEERPRTSERIITSAQIGSELLLIADGFSLEPDDWSAWVKERIYVWRDVWRHYTELFTSLEAGDNQFPGSEGGGGAEKDGASGEAEHPPGSQAQDATSGDVQDTGSGRQEKREDS